MAFVERVASRQLNSVTFEDNATGLRRMVASLATLHYRDANGDFQRIDMTPVRINSGDWSKYPNFDGWLVSQNGWLYGLGVDGWVYFGGRRGEHYVRFRLREVGYVRTTTGAFTAISGLPTYNTANLSAQQTQTAIEGETYVTGTTAEWHNLNTTPGGGELFLRFKARGDGLKAEYVINQAAREWIVAKRPPSFYGIPAAQAYLAFRFDIDFSDIPRRVIAGALQGDTFDDAAGGIELRNALDELLAFMPIGDAYVDTGSDLFRSEVTLRKRFTGSLMTVGAPVAALNALPAGDLVFDPTVTPSVGSSGDDGSWVTGVGFGNTDTSQYIGRYVSTYDVQNFFRFTGVAVPNGATVSAAYVTLVAFATNAGASPGVTVYVVDADNQAAPTDLASAGAMVEYGSGHSWSPPAFTAGNSYDTTNFAASAEGVFARGGWASGNALVVEILSAIGSGGDNRQIATWDHATYAAPQLTITYTPPAQSITPAVISSTATLYAPTVAVAAATQDITPGVISSGATLYAPTVATGAVSITPGAIASGGTVYAPAVTAGVVTITPGLIASSGAVYAPAVSVGAADIAPALIASTAALYAPTVGTGAVNVAPGLIASTGAVYEPSVSVGAATITPAVISSTAALYAPTLTTGAVTITPGLIAASGALYEPVVTQGGVTLLPDVIASTAVLYDPTLTTGAVDITPALIASTAALYEPTITQGATIAPDVIASSATVYEPVITTGAVDITPGLIAGSGAVYEPSVAPGAVTVTPNLIAATGAVYEPVVSQGGVVLTPGLIASTGAVYAPTVTPGAVSIAPGLIAGTGAVYEPVVDTSTVILVGTIASSAAVYAPVVGVGAVTISPPLIAGNTVLYAPIMGTGSVDDIPGAYWALTRDGYLRAVIISAEYHADSIDAEFRAGTRTDEYRATRRPGHYHKRVN